MNKSSANLLAMDMTIGIGTGCTFPLIQTLRAFRRPILDAWRLGGLDEKRLGGRKKSQVSVREKLRVAKKG